MSDLDLALDQAQAAKAAYRDGGSRDGHQAGAAELRYQRWKARGGPAIEADALERLGGHGNRPAAEHYARWLTEKG